MFLLVYLILILLCIYLKYKDVKLNLYPIIVVLLILYAGLRSNYGYDYENYVIYFNEINSLSDVFNTGYEKGYATLIYIFKNFGFGFSTLLLFIAFVSVGLKSITIKRQSIFPELSLLIYFLLFYVYNDVEQIRHGISVSFCFYSFNYLMRDDFKSKIISIFLYILSVLFHTSSILFILVILLKDRKISNKGMISLVCASIILGMVNIFGILELINNALLHSAYLNVKLAAYNNESQPLINASLIIKCVFLAMYYLTAYDKKDRKHRLLFNTYFLGILLTCALNSIPILTARGTLAMRYMEIFIYPICLKKLIDGKTKKYQNALILLFGLYYFVKFFQYILVPEYFFYTSI